MKRLYEITWEPTPDDFDGIKPINAFVPDWEDGKAVDPARWLSDKYNLRVLDLKQLEYRSTLLEFYELSRFIAATTCMFTFFAIVLRVACVLTGAIDPTFLYNVLIPGQFFMSALTGLLFLVLVPFKLWFEDGREKFWNDFRCPRHGNIDLIGLVSVTASYLSVVFMLAGFVVSTITGIPVLSYLN